MKLHYVMLHKSGRTTTETEILLWSFSAQNARTERMLLRTFFPPGKTTGRDPVKKNWGRCRNIQVSRFPGHEGQAQLILHKQTEREKNGMKKRWLGSFLSLCLLVTLLPTAAMAVDEVRIQSAYN